MGTEGYDEDRPMLSVVVSVIWVVEEGRRRVEPNSREVNPFFGPSTSALV